MKTVKIRLVALVITIASLIIACLAGFSSLAQEQGLKVECESTQYSASQADGKKWSPKEASSTMTKESGEGTNGLVFTGGSVGAKIEFTFDSQIEGEYDFSFSARPNENYYADVEVYLNGEQVGETVNFRKGEFVCGKYNVDNRVRDYDLGSVSLRKGNNTVGFVVVESEKAPTSITLALDSIDFRVKGEESNSLQYEAESMRFVAIDSNGDEIKTSNSKGTWAWDLNLGGAANVSVQLTYFRTGGIGGTVDFYPNVKEAGKYSLTVAYRPNNLSYSDVEIYVNDTLIGEYISQKGGVKVGNEVNTANVVREIVMGNADFKKGENKVTFKLVGEGASLKDTAFTLDYIRLGDTVDESKLTFTEPEPEYPAVADKDNSTPVTVTVPDGMLDKYSGTVSKPATTDKITVYPLPECYESSGKYKLTVDGVSVPVYTVSSGAKYADYDYSYAAFDYDPTKGSVEVKVEWDAKISKVTVSPQHINPVYSKDGKELTLIVDRNQNYSLCINGKYLVISADPMQKDVPAKTGTGIFNITEAPYSVNKDMTDAQVTAAIQKALEDASAYGSTAGNKNGVVYIPAGVYYVGNLVISSNTYLYLEGGAVLRISDDESLLDVKAVKTSMTDPLGNAGVSFTWWISTAFEEKITTDPLTEKTKIEVLGSYDIRIGGRGTIDGRDAHYWNTAEEGNHRVGANTVVPIATSYFTLEGLTVRDATCWSIVAVRSDNLTFDNIKMFNVTKRHHDENDGIDVCECQNVVVKNSIGFAMDDPFSAKTWPFRVGITVNWPGYPEISSNVTFENCMSYTQRMGFKIGQGTDQCHYNVTFRNCTVIDATVGIGIHASSGAGIVFDPVFDGIYIEKLHKGGFYANSGWLYLNVQANGRGNGNLRNVVVKNIHIYKGAEGSGKLQITGISSSNAIKGLYFSNIYFNGVRAESLNDLKPGYNRNEFVYNMSLNNGDFPAEENPGEGNTGNENTGNESTGNENTGNENNVDQNNGAESPKNNTLTFVIIASVAAAAVVAAIAGLVIFKRRVKK